ncbi:MAG TPA: IS66 family insertion sequence element accessory protein TnpB [Bdellovibrionota bacterium]|nr:IS66 family insertion sequence element accessory protein TnpB [Bdellovibrionota bacterium]
MFGSRISRILAYQEAVDMRKSFDGLIGVVQTALSEDPLPGTLYVFRNRRGNYVKGIFWDRTGYCLFAKRLERGRFSIPSEERVFELSEKIFFLLLDGIILGSRREVR